MRSQCNTPYPIETANGIVHPDSKVTVTLDALDEEADCLELGKTVCALTIGRRCATHGYRFVWEVHADQPTFQRSDAKFVDLRFENFV